MIQSQGGVDPDTDEVLLNSYDGTFVPI